MKKLLYVILFVLSGCEATEFTVLDIFPFTVNVDVSTNSVYVGDKTEVSITISPEHIVEGTTYNVTPSIVKGNAEIYTNGTLLNNNESFTIDALNYSFSVLAKSIEEIEIAFIVTHGKDTQLNISESIVIVPEFRPLTISLVNNNNEYPLNRYSPITLSISGNASSSYDLNYQIENGQGKIYRQEGDSFVAFPPGESISISGGSHSLFYRPENVANGSHILRGHITASDNNMIPFSLNLTVANLKWDLQAAAETTNPKKKQPFRLTVILSSEDESIDHEVKFNVTGGLLNLKDDKGTIIEFGVWSVLEEGTHQFEYIAPEEGMLLLSIDIRDQNNFTKTSEIQLDVDSIPFFFVGFPAQNEVIINTPVLINLNLTSDFDLSDTALTFGLIQGNGVLKDLKGSVVFPATTLDLGLETTSFNYIPSSSGIHELQFTALVEGVEKTILIEIDVIESDFEFTAQSALANTQVTDSVGQNFTIDGFAGLKYNLSFTTSINGRFKYQNNYYTAGQSIEINQADIDNQAWSGEYIGDLSGTHVIIYTLRDSNGIEKTASTAIIFNSIDYNFTATAAATNVIGINPVDIVLSVASSAPISEIDYSFIITKGEGSLLNGSTPLTPTTKYKLPVGSSTLRFSPSSLEDHQISFTTQYGGVIKTVDVAISFTSTPVYNPFTASLSSVSSATVGSWISQEISFTNADDTKSFEFMYTTSGTGSLTYQGNIYSSGEKISIEKNDITKGVLKFQYIGLEAKQHNVELSISDGITTKDLISNLIFVSDYIAFSATISGASSSTIGNDLGQIITLSGTDDSKSFVLEYTTSGTGSVTYNGTSYLPGASIPIQKSDITGGTIALSYNGTSVGVHSIIYNLSDGITTKPLVSNPIFVSDYMAFSATISGASSSTIGTVLAQTITLSGADDRKSFTLEYTTSGTGSVTYNGTSYLPGASIPIQKSDITGGTIGLSYTGASVGVHSIIYNLSDGITTRPLVSNPIFVSDYMAFSATISGASSSTVGTALGQTITLSGADDRKNFTLEYTTSGTGSITYNGTSYLPGASIPIQKSDITGGTIALSYNGTTEGFHSVVFTIRDGITIKNLAANLVFSFEDFSFTTSYDTTVLRKGISRVLNININGSSQYEFKITSILASNVLNFDDAGIKIPLNTYRDLSGSSLMIKTDGLVGGTTIFEVEIKDKVSGIMKRSSPITVVVDDSFTATLVNPNDLLLGVFAFPINISIDGPTTSNYSVVVSATTINDVGSIVTFSIDDASGDGGAYETNIPIIERDQTLYIKLPTLTGGAYVDLRGSVELNVKIVDNDSKKEILMNKSLFINGTMHHSTYRVITSSLTSPGSVSYADTSINTGNLSRIDVFGEFNHFIPPADYYSAIGTCYNLYHDNELIQPNQIVKITSNIVIELVNNICSPPTYLTGVGYLSELRAFYIDVNFSPVIIFN